MIAWLRDPAVATPLQTCLRPGQSCMPESRQAHCPGERQGSLRCARTSPRHVCPCEQERRQKMAKRWIARVLPQAQCAQMHRLVVITGIESSHRPADQIATIALIVRVVARTLTGSHVLKRPMSIPIMFGGAACHESSRVADLEPRLSSRLTASKGKKATIRPNCCSRALGHTRSSDDHSMSALVNIGYSQGMSIGVRQIPAKAVSC